MIVNPSDAASVGQVAALLQEFRGRLPRDIDEWSRVCAVGCRMAGPGDVLNRRERFAKATYASGQSVDGGVLDKTFGEALRLKRA